MFNIVVKCETCKHYRLNDDKPYATCDAFPDGIPREIFAEEKDHIEPYKGDNGIMFEEKE